MDDDSLDTLVKLLILKKLLSDDDNDKTKAVDVGTRVVRGPDWKWENQDGGEGSVGTVVEIGKGDSFPTSVVSVQWDNGIQKKYRAGLNGAYDLRVLDNAQIGVRHKAVNCDSCQKDGIFGIRWKCKDCFDFDLCTPCYMAGRHDITHQFLRILNPDSSDSPGVAVPKRQGSVRIQQKGIFPSAKVVRGPDWKWDDQDGGTGKIGRVLAIRNWNDETERNAVRIAWSASNKTDIYRLGHAGKVDVKYVQAAADGFYYRDHLPVLGDETRAVKVEERSNSVTEESLSRQASVSENKPPEPKVEPTVVPRVEPRIIKDSTLTKGGIMHLSGNFKDLFYKQKFCDLKIKVGDQTFQAHKAVLTTRSPYFSSKLQENDSVFEVKDLSPSVFKDFLYYVYTGEIASTSAPSVVDLSEIADKYADKILKDECTRVLKKVFAKDNFSNFIAAA